MFSELRAKLMSKSFVLYALPLRIALQPPIMTNSTPASTSA